MATIEFGAGKATTSLDAALTAAGAGGTVLSYGPHTDTKAGLTTWALNNVTWTHMGGGDYEFDGGLATNDCLKINGTGNTLNLLNADATRVKVTGYGRYVFWVNGANNTVNDPYVYDNGFLYVAAPNAHCYHYLLYANSTINRPVIAGGIDTGSRHYGLYIVGSGGGSVTDAAMSGLVTTGAGRVYGVASNGSCGSVLIDGITISNCSASGAVFLFLWGGTGTGDIMQVRRAAVDSVTSAGTCYIFNASARAMDVEDFVVSNCSGSAIVAQAAGSYVGGISRAVSGLIYGMAVDGIQASTSVVGSAPTIRNVIARDCAGIGFRSVGTFAPDSDNNCAYNNGTNYDGWTQGVGDITADPDHADAASGDFTLNAGSPCIDKGATIAGRSDDFNGDPISKQTDIGPFEYQWPPEGHSRWESSFIVAATQRFDITQGIASAQVDIVAGTEYDSVQALLADIEAQLETDTGNAWTLSTIDNTERVRIATTGGSFTWDWTGGAVTSTEVRDLLGYAADASAQASPWAATSAPDYTIWLSERPQSGTQSGGFNLSRQSQSARTIDGTHDASAVYGGLKRQRSVVVNLARDGAGAWDEITDWHTFLAWIGDGRLFTVWDDVSAPVPVAMYFAGPEEIEVRKRFDRGVTYWRSTIAGNEA